MNDGSTPPRKPLSERQRKNEERRAKRAEEKARLAQAIETIKQGMTKVVAEEFMLMCETLGDPRPLWATMTNTDLTEGRGNQIAIAFAASEATALRLGLGKGVMGSNASAKQCWGWCLDEDEYGPGGPWLIVVGSTWHPAKLAKPSDQDKLIEEHGRAYVDALAKARGALSADELAMLGIPS